MKRTAWTGLVISSFVGCLLAACAAGTSAAQSPPAPTSSSIFVVRHAEKADPSDPDTPLSPAGEARAQALAAVLRSKGVRTVFATEFKRTQQTAAPTAKGAGVDVVIINNADRPQLLERARAVPMGEAVLIVGHSNTVPDIVRELSGEEVDGINENEFNNLYEVVIDADGRKRLVRSRYGEPSR